MKLRVTHLITKLELGGAQRNTLYTVSHLSKERFEVDLISGMGGLLDPEARQLGIPLYFVPALVRPIHPIKDLWAFVETYQILRRTRPHIVHTHSSKAGIIGRIAAYLAGIPVITHTFHGFGFTPTQHPVLRRWLIWVERFCALLSTHLIFVSEENRREAEFLRIGYGTPSSLIRSGISLQKPPPSTLRQELGLSPETWVVCMVGNFKPQKNPLDTLKVAASVLSKDASIHFLLVGDGPLRAQAEAWAGSAGLTKNVHFLGWRTDVQNILAGSNAFLLTSLWEGLPRSLVEAFAAELPAVAYAVDGVKELIQEDHNGHLIPSGNTELAAERLLTLKMNPERSKTMGKAGRTRVEKEFDIDAMVRQQETLYESLYAKVPLKDLYEPLWKTNE